MYRRRAPRPDRGQAVLLMVAVLVLAGVLASAVAQMAVTAARRDQAQAAADAAALAGSRGGHDEARRLAAANGADLVRFRVLDTHTATVEVVVRVGGVTATARASRAP